MKKLLKIAGIIIIGGFLSVVVVDTIKEGFRLEAERQCIVAQDMCEKYPESCRDVKRYCE